MRTLLLWLEAPLQSWGAGSRYSRRDSLPFPTRSGILGLLCCAVGRGGEQREWLGMMKDLPQTVTGYAPVDRFNKAVRYPLLRDFHMVGSGYDSSDPWQDLLIPKKSDGKRPVGSGARLTHRYYLQDMAFACALSVPECLEGELEAGLREPVWPVCLGRRSCIPTDIVFRGFFESEKEAQDAADCLAADKKRLAVFRVIPGGHDTGTVMVLNDVPVRFGLQKRYEDRTVTMIDLP